MISLDLVLFKSKGSQIANLPNLGCGFGLAGPDLKALLVLRVFVCLSIIES